MHESPADIEALQELLDRSYAEAGAHLLKIHTPDRRLGAAQAGFRQALLAIYEPRYGPEWEQFLDSGPVYARIDADRMFALAIPSARLPG